MSHRSRRARVFAHAAMVAAVVAALVLAGAPGPVRAQVFLAADAHPPFSIGPLLVLASVAPELGSVAVRVSWNLTLAPHARREDVRQDLYLLWPAEVEGATEPGAAEPGVRSFVQERASRSPGRGGTRSAPATAHTSAPPPRARVSTWWPRSSRSTGEAPTRPSPASARSSGPRPMQVRPVLGSPDNGQAGGKIVRGGRALAGKAPGRPGGRSR